MNKMFYLKALIFIVFLMLLNKLSDDFLMRHGVPIVTDDIFKTLGTILAIHFILTVNLGAAIGNIVVPLSTWKFIGHVSGAILLF